MEKMQSRVIIQDTFAPKPSKVKPKEWNLPSHTAASKTLMRLYYDIKP